MPPTLLELRNLEIQLDGNRSVRGNLALNPGEAHRLGGRSGGGKTTLLRAVSLLSPRKSGEVFFRGKESAEFQPWEWRRQVCYLAQKPVMLPGSVRDNLALPSTLKIAGKSSFNCEKCEELLTGLGLEKSLLDRDSAVISGGEAARIAVIRAVLSNPSVILADEITAPLDDENALHVVKFLKKWLQEGERGLIFVAHQNEAWEGTVCCESDVENFQT